MAELPSGTVTFVFTDIEGSTALVKRLRDRNRDVLDEHQAIVRAAFGNHGGHEIDTQGDSFFFAFPPARRGRRRRRGTARARGARVACGRPCARPHRRYPVASGFFIPILTCASFLPETPTNSNSAAFCDPRIDARIDSALVAQATNPDAARGQWERVDRELVDAAPWVPLVNPQVVEVVAKHVGNYQYTPQYGMLIDQLWVR